MPGKGTPALVAAEQAGIAFRVREYVHDPKAPSYGLEAAEKLDVDPGRVFKTLVVDVDGAHTIAIVPVEAELDRQGLWDRIERRPKQPGDMAPPPGGEMEAME